jgi:hypothetical protein
MVESNTHCAPILRQCAFSSHGLAGVLATRYSARLWISAVESVSP